MPLSPGDKLGPYEIVAPLGAGGMGEVYRARDPKLNRDVAIKVLPAALSDDPQYMARFEREAQLLAALSHPNIAAVYGIEQGAIVMELVEGDDLKGPLPLDEALGVARQIAAGLEAAHERGIIHRDLKPANIKITPAGGVKILDFGLAKSVSESSAAVGSNPTISPTLSLAMTQAGMILGTAAYMSPEQARGKPVDKRTDIWAFGVVLYEMVTGRRLFEGEDLTETLASVVKDRPDLSSVPEKVRPLLERCLEKDPKKRLRDIGDMELLLTEAAAPAGETAPSGTRFGNAGWIVAAVLAMVAGTASWIGSHATRPAPLKPLVRLDVDLGAELMAPATGGPNAILSPDGARLAYFSQGKLFARRLDQPKAVELAGTLGATAPFFSPDGLWVAFFNSGKLMKISAEGGAPITLLDGVSGSGSWAEDGSIIVTHNGLSRVPSAGGPAVQVIPLVSGESKRWPQVLPGSKAALFTVHRRTSGDGEDRVDVAILADKSRKTLIPGATFGRYLPASNGTGHLVYLNKGTLFAVPFDPGKLEIQGSPAPVLDDVASFDFSRDGTLAYRSGVASGADLVTLEWLDAEGKTQPILSKPGRYQVPRVSPDGQRVAVVDGPDIWVYEAKRDILTRLTFGGGPNDRPVWSPDGRFIVYQAPGGIWWIRSDGASKPQKLMDGYQPFSFTSDGKWLTGVAAGTGIWTVAIQTDSAGLRAGTPQNVVNAIQPAFSPDGRWLAYSSNESGPLRVYVRAFPDKGGIWQVSDEGGAYPVWSRNGRELFFRSEDNRIMAVAYDARSDSFAHDKPRLWSSRQLAIATPTGGYNFDPAPDGKRVAVLMPAETPEAKRARSQLTFLLNFADELQRKALTGR
jgi:Tol biopolymer transport system component